MQFQFRLRLGNRLEVRGHDDCCKQECTCLPLSNEDWDFERADSTYPIVLPHYFAHMLKHPKRNIHEEQTHIHKWIPKFKGAELLVDPKKELADGWGLYFEEGWAIEDVITLVGLIFIISFVFLVCYSKYKSDVSAASGVSSWMMTAISAFIAVLVVRAGSMMM